MFECVCMCVCMSVTTSLTLHLLAASLVLVCVCVPPPQVDLPLDGAVSPLYVVAACCAVNNYYNSPKQTVGLEGGY